MFTGIIEEVGEVVSLKEHGTNLNMEIKATMAPELRVDQSVAHNGVCLTVVKVDIDRYTVTLVKETLDRSNLGSMHVGDDVNLERSLRVGDRLDGHMVQGHVDTMTTCTDVKDLDGSRWYIFELPVRKELLVEKGSICINGVSLTIAELTGKIFSIAVIPYTYAHTTFRSLGPGMHVNIEYDVLGKYVERMMASRVSS